MNDENEVEKITDIVQWFEYRQKLAVLLEMLCEQVGATEYISLPGLKDYLDQSDFFVRRSLPLRYFNHTHLEYQQQFGDFLSNMLVVDSLFNCGHESLPLFEKGFKVS